MSKDSIPRIDGVEYTTNPNGAPVGATFALDFPIEDHDPPVHALNLRRMRAGDALVAEEVEREAEAGFALFAALAGTGVEVIGKLDNEDFERLTEALLPLMGKSAGKVFASLRKEEQEAMSAKGANKASTTPPVGRQA